MNGIEINKVFILDPGSESIFYKFDGKTLFVNGFFDNKTHVDCLAEKCRCDDPEVCILRNESFQGAFKYVEGQDHLFPKLGLAS